MATRIKQRKFQARVLFGNTKPTPAEATEFFEDDLVEANGIHLFERFGDKLFSSFFQSDVSIRRFDIVPVDINTDGNGDVTDATVIIDTVYGPDPLRMPTPAEEDAYRATLTTGNETYSEAFQQAALDKWGQSSQVEVLQAGIDELSPVTEDDGL